MRQRVACVLIAGVVALAGVAIASGPVVGPALARLLGGVASPSLVFEVTLPPGLDAAAADGLEQTWRARLAGRDVRIGVVAWEPTPTLRIIVTPATRADERSVRAALEQSGSFAFEEVLADTGWARDAFRAVQDGRVGPDVTADVDAWRADETGESYTDFFLRAATEDALDAAIAALDAPIEPGTLIRYEHVAPYDPGDAPHVRTYVVAAEPLLDHREVAAAEVTWDPQWNRPQVLLTFTDDGARRFGDVTAAMVGRKMAIVVDGRIVSAPVIQGAITGGRASIDMGSGTPEELEARAHALAASLRGAGPALPDGITAALVAVDEPVAAVVWGVRLGFGALAGALAWLLANLLARQAWTRPRRDPPPGGPARLDALAAPAAVTAGVVAALVLLERVRLPGVSEEVLLISQDVAPISVVAVGFWPVLTAFGLVELIALLVPRLRARRLGTPGDRAGLDLAVLVVAVVLAALQGWFLAQYLQAMGLGVLDAPVLASGALPTLAVIATIVGGVVLHVVAAEVITRRGLANGWVVLLGVALAREAWATLRAPHTPLAVDLAHVAVAAVAIAAALGLARRRGAAGDQPRMPPGGIMPILIVPSVLAIAALPYVLEALGPDALARLHQRPAWAELVVVAAVAAVVAWRAHPGSDRAIAIGVGLSVLLAALPLTLSPVDRPLALALPGVLLAAAVVEVVAGARRRARHPTWRPLIALHDVDRVERLVDRLAGAAIPAVTTGDTMRALLRFFGPFVPVVVYVPADRLADAAEVAAPLQPPPAR